LSDGDGDRIGNCDGDRIGNCDGNGDGDWIGNDGGDGDNDCPFRAPLPHFEGHGRKRSGAREAARWRSPPDRRRA